MMKRFFLIILISSIFFSNAFAYIFLTQTIPSDICVTTAQHASKIGTATETTFFGLFTSGDASVMKAMEEAKITKIHHVEYARKNYYIFLSEYKIIVYGE